MNPDGKSEDSPFAVIEVGNGRFILAVVCVFGNEPRDWLACISRMDDGPWEIRHRFRYYNSDDPWDRLDKKNFHAATAPSGHSIEKMLGTLRKMATGIVALGFNDKFELLELQSADADYIMYELMKRPWIHAKLTGDMPS